jgi:hypothetical protein
MADDSGSNQIILTVKLGGDIVKEFDDMMTQIEQRAATIGKGLEIQSPAAPLSALEPEKPLEKEHSIPADEDTDKVAKHATEAALAFDALHKSVVGTVRELSGSKVSEAIGAFQEVRALQDIADALKRAAAESAVAKEGYSGFLSVLGRGATLLAGAAGTVAAYGAAAIKTAKHAQELVLQIKDLGAATGMSTSQVIALKNAFQSVGAGDEQLQMSMRSLGLAIQSSWAQIGDNIRDSADKQREALIHVEEANRGYASALDAIKEKAIDAAGAQDRLADAAERVRHGETNIADAKVSALKSRLEFQQKYQGIEPTQIDYDQLQNLERVAAYSHERDSQRAVDNAERQQRENVRGLEKAQIELSPEKVARDVAQSFADAVLARIGATRALNEQHAELRTDLPTILGNIKGERNDLNLREVDPMQLFMAVASQYQGQPIGEQMFRTVHDIGEFGMRPEMQGVMSSAIGRTVQTRGISPGSLLRAWSEMNPDHPAMPQDAATVELIDKLAPLAQEVEAQQQRARWNWDKSSIAFGGAAMPGLKKYEETYANAVGALANNAPGIVNFGKEAAPYAGGAYGLYALYHMFSGATGGLEGSAKALDGSAAALTGAAEKLSAGAVARGAGAAAEGAAVAEGAGAAAAGAGAAAGSGAAPAVAAATGGIMAGAGVAAVATAASAATLAFLGVTALEVKDAAGMVGRVWRHEPIPTTPAEGQMTPEQVKAENASIAEDKKFGFRLSERLAEYEEALPNATAALKEPEGILKQAQQMPEGKGRAAIEAQWNPVLETAQKNLAEITTGIATMKAMQTGEKPANTAAPRPVEQIGQAAPKEDDASKKVADAKTKEVAATDSATKAIEDFAAKARAAGFAFRTPETGAPAQGGFSAEQAQRFHMRFPPPPETTPAFNQPVVGAAMPGEKVAHGMDSAASAAERFAQRISSIDIRAPAFGVASPTQQTSPYGTLGIEQSAPAEGHARGGMIRGPGTGTSDSIFRYLKEGDFVIRASATSRLGHTFLDKVNERRFAAGGHVPAYVSDGEYHVDHEAVAHYGAPFMHALNAVGHADGGEVQDDASPSTMGGEFPVLRFAGGGDLADSIKAVTQDMGHAIFAPGGAFNEPQKRKGRKDAPGAAQTAENLAMALGGGIRLAGGGFASVGTGMAGVGPFASMNSMGQIGSAEGALAGISQYASAYLSGMNSNIFGGLGGFGMASMIGNVGALRGLGISGFHALNLQTDAGSFLVTADESTMAALKGSAISEKITSSGSKPSWWA